MKVIALETGFDGITIRHPGDEFELPNEVVERQGRKWFEPADPAVKANLAAAAAAADKPEVVAVDPAKQAADKQASDEKAAKDHAKQK